MLNSTYQITHASHYLRQSGKLAQNPLETTPEIQNKFQRTMDTAITG